MKISAMNVKITFQENCTIIDKIGNHINEWRDYYTCHATVTGESGTEEFTAGEIVENIDIAFTVRYCKKGVFNYKHKFQNCFQQRALRYRSDRSFFIQEPSREIQVSEGETMSSIKIDDLAREVMRGLGRVRRCYNGSGQESSSQSRKYGQT